MENKYQLSDPAAALIEAAELSDESKIRLTDAMYAWAHAAMNSEEIEHTDAPGHFPFVVSELYRSVSIFKRFGKERVNSALELLCNAGIVSAEYSRATGARPQNIRCIKAEFALRDNIRTFDELELEVVSLVLGAYKTDSSKSSSPPNEPSTQTVKYGPVRVLKDFGCNYLGMFVIFRQTQIIDDEHQAKYLLETNAPVAHLDDMDTAVCSCGHQFKISEAPIPDLVFVAHADFRFSLNGSVIIKQKDDLIDDYWHCRYLLEGNMYPISLAKPEDITTCPQCKLTSWRAKLLGQYLSPVKRAEILKQQSYPPQEKIEYKPSLAPAAPQRTLTDNLKADLSHIEDFETRLEIRHWEPGSIHAPKLT